MDLQQFTKYYKNTIDLNEHFLIKQKEFMVQLLLLFHEVFYVSFQK